MSSFIKSFRDPTLTAEENKQLNIHVEKNARLLGIHTTPELVIFLKEHDVLGKGIYAALDAMKKEVEKRGLGNAKHS